MADPPWLVVATHNKPKRTPEQEPRRTACRRTAESPVATSSYPLASLDLTRDVAITPSHPGTHDHAAARRALARRRPCQPPTKAQVPAAAELDERPPRRVRQAPADQQAPDAIRALVEIRHGEVGQHRPPVARSAPPDGDVAE